MRELTGYEMFTNAHGVFLRAGPRVAGPHKGVWEHWDTMAAQRRLSGPATCRCEDCGSEWPEAGRFPAQCQP